jgi:hypothetical protein
MTKHYATLDGIKRAAIKLKRRTGVSHSHALDQIAREAGYPDFFSASQAYAASGDVARHPVTIYEFWSDRPAGTRGNESRTFLLDRPLGELVKPHQLTGYLGGAKLSDENAIIGCGNSHNPAQARAEICRIARTLQFMAATGLKPSRGSRCYPKGDQDNRPPGADHDQGWYDPATRSFLLTEEPYPGRHRSHADERKRWAEKHGWRTVQSQWGSMYGHGTELYLTAKADGINLAGIARRLAALPAPFSEQDWPSDDGPAGPPAQSPVEIIEMSPELAAALKHQRDLDIADAGQRAPELSGNYRGIDISSRWDIAHEFKTMHEIVDAMPDLVRARVASMWCDSNAQAYYSVTIAPGRWYEGIEFDIRDTVRAVTSGFNGLSVEGDRNNRMFDPEWEGDDYDHSDGTTGEPVEWDVDDL